MKRMLIAVAAIASLGLAGAAVAQSGGDLFKSKGCATCHAADTAKMGPSLKDIGGKYKADAADKLVAALKDGKSTGGKTHPKPAGTDAEIKSMVMYAVTGR
jgi:cytochrome c